LLNRARSVGVFAREAIRDGLGCTIRAADANSEGDALSALVFGVRTKPDQPQEEAVDVPG